MTETSTALRRAIWDTLPEHAPGIGAKEVRVALAARGIQRGADTIKLTLPKMRRDGLVACTKAAPPDVFRWYRGPIGMQSVAAAPVQPASFRTNPHYLLTATMLRGVQTPLSVKAYTGEPVPADEDICRVTAAALGVRWRGWQDLPALNAARPKNLPPFAPPKRDVVAPTHPMVRT